MPGPARLDGHAPPDSIAACGTWRALRAGDSESAHSSLTLAVASWLNNAKPVRAADALWMLAQLACAHGRTADALALCGVMTATVLTEGEEDGARARCRTGAVLLAAGHLVDAIDTLKGAYDRLGGESCHDIGLVADVAMMLGFAIRLRPRSSLRPASRYFTHAAATLPPGTRADYALTLAVAAPRAQLPGPPFAAEGIEQPWPGIGCPTSAVWLTGYLTPVDPHPAGLPCPGCTPVQDARPC
ncbi:hypothetical protein [Amycolatopsis sp. H20-H5]|uniref:hypothetical protein n=1 Tax=Amycolatopsis sp. H20-H5 TaxID=3046309 RepID=UPI002DB79D7D|nr:hypothetical protein [Amycolatopsis sp. H20-H5]MEC3977776.1 hypothetical protein [Amycolatopsis sp. H20-H5]